MHGSPETLLQPQAAVWCGWQAGGMALSAKLCRVLRDTAPEMKCYQSKLQYSCHGNYKMGNHRCDLFHCHMPYGEILVPWIVEGDSKCGVYPNGCIFFCAG